jgi:hypothetical protein
VPDGEHRIVCDFPNACCSGCQIGDGINDGPALTAPPIDPSGPRISFGKDI